MATVHLHYNLWCRIRWWLTEDMAPGPLTMARHQFGAMAGCGPLETCYPGCMSSSTRRFVSAKMSASYPGSLETAESSSQPEQYIQCRRFCGCNGHVLVPVLHWQGVCGQPVQCMHARNSRHSSKG